MLCFAVEKSSFQVMIAPLAPPLPLSGVGTHCDATILPKLEISQRLRTGNTVKTQSGDAIAVGVPDAPEASELFKGFLQSPLFLKNI
jgi:hypothetical protein